MEKLFVHFMQVALHGSISQASVFLGVTQPAISKSIKLLEERYDTSLLIRKARGVELTPAGVIVLERCIRIDNEMTAMVNDIGSLFTEKEKIRVGAGPAWELPIKAMISDFLLKFPNVHMEIQSNTITKLIPELVADNLDVALGGENGTYSLKSNELSFIPLIDSRLCIVANENHKLAKISECRLEELTHYQWVGYQNSKKMLEQVNHLLDREQVNPVNFILETEFLDVALTVVEKNDALLCISNILLEKLEGKGIVEVKLKEPIWYFHIGVWAKPSHQRRYLVNEFIKAISSQAELYNLNHTSSFIE